MCMASTLLERQWKLGVVMRVCCRQMAPLLRRTVWKRSREWREKTERKRPPSGNRGRRSLIHYAMHTIGAVHYHFVYVCFEIILQYSSIVVQASRPLSVRHVYVFFFYQAARRQWEGRSYILLLYFFYRTFNLADRGLAPPKVHTRGWVIAYRSSTKKCRHFAHLSPNFTRRKKWPRFSSQLHLSRPSFEKKQKSNISKKLVQQR